MIDENEILARLAADLRAAGINPDKYLKRPSGPLGTLSALRPLIDVSYRCMQCGAAFKTRDGAIAHIAKKHFKSHYNIRDRITW